MNKIKNRSELKKFSPEFYKFLEEKHPDLIDREFSANTNNVWTKEKILAESKKFDKIFEWRKNSRLSYRAARKRGKDFYNMCTSHMNNGYHTGSKIIWNKESVKQKALEYRSRAEWCKKSRASYYFAREQGKEFYSECCSHMPPMPQKGVTREKAIEEALKYQNINQWSKNSAYTYVFAKRRGEDFFNKCTSHMKKLNKWNKDNILKEIKMFKSESEWKRLSRTSHRAAVRLGDEFLKKCINIINKRTRRVSDA